MAGSAAYQRVDRPYSLLAQNEGSATDQTEKAFVFRAETEISWSPFPTKAGAPVGTRLHRSLCNILKSHCNFKSLPTDRKPGPSGPSIGSELTALEVKKYAPRMVELNLLVELMLTESKEHLDAVSKVSSEFGSKMKVYFKDNKFPELKPVVGRPVDVFRDSVR